jgi:DNA-directed RNA polymerase omega subunit
MIKQFQREDLIKYTNNSIFKLVILASRRALELNSGMPKLIESSPGKVGSIALEGIRQGKVRLADVKA